MAREVDGKKECPKCHTAFPVDEYVAHIKTHVSQEREVSLCPIDKCSRFLRENEGLIIRTERRSDVISDHKEVGDEEDDSLDSEDLLSLLNQDFKRSTVTFYTHPGVKLHDDVAYQMPSHRSFL